MNVQQEDLGNENETAIQDPFDALKESSIVNGNRSLIGQNGINEVNEEISTDLPEENVGHNANISFGKRKSRMRNIIDSESEEEQHKNTETVDNEDDGDGIKRPRGLSDSDTEKPTTKRSRIIDSDED